jgi:hypothetical protein
MKSSRDFDFLTEQLPHDFNGCALETDFRVALVFFREYAEWEESERAQKTLDMFFPHGVAGEPEQVGEFLRWYLSCGDVPEDDDEEEAEAKPIDKSYDFVEDSAKIYASFIQAYQIDLTTARLHWWSFMALFRALPEDTFMQRVIEIRTKKPETGKGYDKYNAALRKQKEAFALHGTQADEFDVFAGL